MKAVSLAYSTLLCGALAYSSAFAEDGRVCRPLAEVRTENDAAKHRWIELSREQWYFIAGNYTLNPATPEGLPYGNKAVLVTPEKDSSRGMVIFIDGDQACTPLPVPPTLMTLLLSVGVKINHAGAL